METVSTTAVAWYLTRLNNEAHAIRASPRSLMETVSTTAVAWYLTRPNNEAHAIRASPRSLMETVSTTRGSVVPDPTQQ
jgi:hypothetical protein